MGVDDKNIRLTMFQVIDSDSYFKPDAPFSKNSESTLSLYYSLPRDYEKLSDYTGMTSNDDNTCEETAGDDIIKADDRILESNNCSSSRLEI